MASITIAVLNACTVLDDGAITAALPALQRQVHEHVAPAWGADADLIFVPRGQAPPAGAWWLVILDDSDYAGALGYHDLTNEGMPLGKVFARTDQQYNLAWTVTASHELLEMLADPDINLSAFNATGGNTASFYAYEICDPCELDEQGYDIDGVLVSDFVYPAWFQGFRTSGSTRFDHMGAISDPFALLPGGYAQLLDIPSGLGWYQINGPAPAGPAQARKPLPSIGTRRERRMRNEWQVSGVPVGAASVSAAPGSRERTLAAARAASSSVAQGIWIPSARANIVSPRRRSITGR
jgi:hypothetical protein